MLKPNITIRRKNSFMNKENIVKYKSMANISITCKFLCGQYISSPKLKSVSNAYAYGTGKCQHTFKIRWNSSVSINQMNRTKFGKTFLFIKKICSSLSLMLILPIQMYNNYSEGNSYSSDYMVNINNPDIQQTIFLRQPPIIRTNLF